MLVPLPWSWQCQCELKVILELKASASAQALLPSAWSRGSGESSESTGLEEGSSGQRHEHASVPPSMGCFLHSTGLFLAVLLFTAPFASSE